MFRGDRARKRRLELGLKLPEVAELTGKAKSTIAGYEKEETPGKYFRTPLAKDLSKLADALQTTSDYLIDRTDNPYNPHINLLQYIKYEKDFTIGGKTMSENDMNFLIRTLENIANLPSKSENQTDEIKSNK
ncbi:helix-turn-helix domain-containing protein [Fictibacillus sp. NRS-1165]|uniref:helix-turn-helix domain-containing protein n=1 Tax=Fictibacillus sp. NRS-1165 TaxID=3144463 RepID=UPI003D1B67A1